MGSGLRYDLAAGQFIQNWKTPKKVGCFKVTVSTVDGSFFTANFELELAEEDAGFGMGGRSSDRPFCARPGGQLRS